MLIDYPMSQKKRPMRESSNETRAKGRPIKNPRGLQSASPMAFFLLLKREICQGFFFPDYLFFFFPPLVNYYQFQVYFGRIYYFGLFIVKVVFLALEVSVFRSWFHGVHVVRIHLGIGCVHNGTDLGGYIDNEWSLNIKTVLHSNSLHNPQYQRS